MGKEDIIINMIQQLSQNSFEQNRQMMAKMAELEKTIDSLQKQNKELQLNVISMSPMYSDEERKQAMSELAAMKEAERIEKENAAYFESNRIM